MIEITEAFSSYSVSSIAQVSAFYTDILHVKVISIPEGLSLKLPGTSIFIYPKGNQHQPATFTVVNFQVKNIDQAVDELMQKGVQFEQYNNEYLKTDEKGIVRDTHRSMAWFKDPAGNILSLIQQNASS